MKFCIGGGLRQQSVEPIHDAANDRDGRFTHVGSSAEIMPLAGPGTRVIDLKGRCVLPGLHDNHIHLIRGGLNYNLELRWDGVHSLADAMSMLKHQVSVTPPPQWVRVVGGFASSSSAPADPRGTECRRARDTGVPVASL